MAAELDDGVIMMCVRVHMGVCMGHACVPARWLAVCARAREYLDLLRHKALRKRRVILLELLMLLTSLLSHSRRAGTAWSNVSNVPARLSRTCRIPVCRVAMPVCFAT